MCSSPQDSLSHISDLLEEPLPDEQLRDALEQTACQDAFENYADWDVPVDAEHQSFYKSVQAGLLPALARSGRPTSLLELTAALRVILEDPDAILRWCAGENVFAAAELSPDDPEQQAFLPWTPSDSLRHAVE